MLYLKLTLPTADSKHRPVFWRFGKEPNHSDSAADVIERLTEPDSSEKTL